MTNAHQKHNAGSSPLDTLPRLATGKGFDLLEGIRILDLTTSVAGPFATMLLADMGAEVMKLERPGLGDDARAWGPPFLNGESLWFLSVNRNKKSLSFDHSSPEGRAVLHDLVRQSDVVVVNQPPRVAGKLGLDAASLQQIRPDLVYVSITGFGLAGERADWTCYDLIAEGYSGVMDLTGEAGGEAQKIGTPSSRLRSGWLSLRKQFHGEQHLQPHAQHQRRQLLWQPPCPADRGRNLQGPRRLPAGQVQEVRRPTARRCTCEDE